MSNKVLTRLSDWAAGRLGPPRLWTEDEWHKLTSKEKIWITYKHTFHMIGIGNGELDNVLFFLRGEFLTQAGMASLLVLNLGLPSWCYFIYPLFYFIYKYVQWWIGNRIDAADLIALDSEINNKRSIAFRELRKQANNEPFRKNL